MLTFSPSPLGIHQSSLQGCPLRAPGLRCAAGWTEIVDKHDGHQRPPAHASQLHHRPVPCAAYRKRKYQGTNEAVLT